MLRKKKNHLIYFECKQRVVAGCKFAQGVSQTRLFPRVALIVRPCIINASLRKPMTLEPCANRKHQQAVHVNSLCAQGDEFTHSTALFSPQRKSFHSKEVSVELFSDTCPAWQHKRFLLILPQTFTVLTPCWQVCLFLIFALHYNNWKPLVKAKTNLIPFLLKRLEYIPHELVFRERILDKVCHRKWSTQWLKWSETRDNLVSFWFIMNLRFVSSHSFSALPSSQLFAHISFQRKDCWAKW